MMPQVGAAVKAIHLHAEARTEAHVLCEGCQYILYILYSLYRAMQESSTYVVLSPYRAPPTEPSAK